MGHHRKTGILLEAPHGIRVSLEGRRRVSYAGRSALPVSDVAPTALADMLLALAEEHEGPGSTRVVMPVDECENFLRVCTVPSSGGAERIQSETVRWLEEEYGVETEEQEVFTCSYQVKGKLAVAVTVAERGRMVQFQEALVSAGLRDVVLLSPLDALISLFLSVCASEPLACRAFVHVGQRDSLVLLTRDRLPVFFRSFRRELCGQEPDDDRYGRFNAGGLPDVRPDQASISALGEEFNRTLQSYGLVADDEFAVEEVVLTGCGVDVRSMSRTFQSTTGISVVSPPVPKELVVSSDDSEESTAFRHEWPQLALPAVVAMQRQIKSRARLAVAPSRTAQFLAGKGAMIALAAVWFVLALVVLLLLTAHLSRLRGRQLELQQTQQDLTRQISMRREMQRKRKEYIAATQMLLRMKLQGVLAARLLATANNVRPPEVVLSGIGLTLAEERLTLGVDGQFEEITHRDALLSANAYVKRMRETGSFDTVFLEKPVLSQTTVSVPSSDGPVLSTYDTGRGVGPDLRGGTQLGPWNRVRDRRPRYGGRGHRDPRVKDFRPDKHHDRREDRRQVRPRVREVETLKEKKLLTFRLTAIDLAPWQRRAQQ